MAGKDKEAIVICLDVGPMMSQSPPGYCSDLETAIDVISKILQRKLFSESKDEVCLVLFGTPDTANNLSDNGYDNITEARPMGMVDLDLLQYVKSEIPPSNLSADFLDALTVSMDIIHKVTDAPGSKFTASRVILCSNLGGEFSQDKQENIIQAIKGLKTEINFIGPSNLGGDDSEDGGGPDQAGPSTSGKRQGKPKTPQQNLGERQMMEIIEEVDGDAYSFGDVMPLLSFFETKPVRQTPWKCNLEIGNNLKVPVCGYIRVKQAAAKSWKSVFEKGANKQYTPKGVTSFHLNDEEETEVEEDDIVEGHRYGSDVIPISKEDKANMDYKLPGKMLQVLGFTKSENVKRHQYMGRSVFAFVADPNDDHGGVAFSAIVKALYETNSVAIVRRGATARSQPKLACLVPHIKVKYESLLFFELPYAEDLRTYTFPSITENEKFKPSEEQLQAVDKLIDSMDLMGENGEPDDDDDDEGDNEMLKPKEILNPVFQRLYQCLLHRALNPNDTIQEIDEMLKASLERPQAVSASSCQAVEEMQKVFKLEVTKKSDKGTGENVFGVINQNGDAPKTAAPAPDNADVTMADMAQGAITEVGSVNPVSDFQKLVKDADDTTFKRVCKEMQNRIHQLVLESFGSQFFKKALDCLKSLRTETCQRKEPDLFNTFLRDTKQKLKSTSKTAFWQKMCTENLTLISKVECPTSDVTEEDSKKFLQDQAASQEVEMAAPDESADDLLDMME
ncbi:X-ray repair cross-complementing protein 5-like isoform X4 [Apostichopus japonicus]|uniref:X-ray repair cross-complementing protein 5-like isoform X2 n=1 Tax=Stichopus japonicus TaxID=307972 RepID=UPI003AB4BB41